MTQVRFIIQDDLGGTWGDFAHYRTKEDAVEAFPRVVEANVEYSVTWGKPTVNFRLIRRAVTSVEEVVEL